MHGVPAPRQAKPLLCPNHFLGSCRREMECSYAHSIAELRAWGGEVPPNGGQMPPPPPADQVRFVAPEQQHQVAQQQMQMQLGPQGMRPTTAEEAVRVLQQMAPTLLAGHLQVRSPCLSERFSESC